MPNTRATGPEEQVNALAEAVDTLHTKLADQAKDAAKDAKEREDRLRQEADVRAKTLADQMKANEDMMTQMMAQPTALAGQGAVAAGGQPPAASAAATPAATSTTTSTMTTTCLLYTSPSPRDGLLSRMPSSA